LAKIEKNEPLDSQFLKGLFKDINEDKLYCLLEGLKFYLGKLVKLSFKEGIKYFFTKREGFGKSRELTFFYNKCKLIYEKIKGKKPERALYPACGKDWSGTFEALKEMVVVGLDAAPQQYKDKEILIAQLESDKIEKPDNFFDFIAIGKITALINSPNAIEEFKRVIKPGGMIIVQREGGIYPMPGQVEDFIKPYLDLGKIVSSSRSGYFTAIQIEK